MKPNIRWQLLLAVVGMGLILALLSFQALTASLCTVTVPSAGGIFVEGIVGAPQYLNPLLDDAYPVDREIDSLLFDGLTTHDENGRLIPALAESWTVGEDGKSLQFIMRDDVYWHDGEPVTAADVVFTYKLMQDDAFAGSQSLQNLWQSVTINQLGDKTVEFLLEEPYSPFLEETTRGILPAHLLQGTTAAQLATHPFNQSPVGTGPFMVAPDQDWNRTHRLRLLPNPTAWHQGTQIAALEYRFFADEETLLDAFLADEIHAMNAVSPAMLPALSEADGARLFTAMSPRYTELLFNLTETAHPLVGSLEGRQALAMALDRDRLVDVVRNGQGVLLDGQYLPSSWAYNEALLTVYEFDVETAVSLLNTAGGQDSTPIRLLALNDPTAQATATELIAQWAAVGIVAELTTADNLAALRQQLDEGQFDIALLDISPPADPDLYDFWSQEAIIRGSNYAGWNNRRASEALENGRKLWPLDERIAQYDTFTRLFEQELPALTLYQHTNSYALSSDVQNADIGLITHARDRYKTMADWFLLYRDVAVSCPTE